MSAEEQRPIRLGLFLSAQHPESADPGRAIADHLEQVALARELGYDSVFAGQHFLSHPFQMFQSVPLLARIAAEAGEMTVGTGVLLLTLLNPVEVAENAATLDAIVEGEFVLGVGFGYRSIENAAFGIRERRAEVFEAKIDIVRRLLAGDAVTGRGEAFELEEARLSMVPETPPPIWMAANADRAVSRAARLGDAWLINPHSRLDELERQVEQFRAERLALGRPLSAVPIIKEICVAATDSEAIETARPYLEAKYEAYVDWGQSEVLPSGDTLRREWEQLTEGGRFILGSPQTCAAQLQEHVDRLGVDHVICRVQWPGMPQQEALKTMHLLADEVRPALQAD